MSMDSISNPATGNEECSTTTTNDLSLIPESANHSHDSSDPHSKTTQKRLPLLSSYRTTSTNNSTSSLTTKKHAAGPKNSDNGKQREDQQPPEKQQSMYNYLFNKADTPHHNLPQQRQESSTFSTRPSKSKSTSIASTRSTTQRNSTHYIHKNQHHSLKRATTISSKSTLDVYLQKQPPEPSTSRKSIKRQPSVSDDANCLLLYTHRHAHLPFFPSPFSLV